MPRIITKEEQFALQVIIDALWEDEYKHWEESEKPEHHIFTYLRQLCDLADRKTLENNVLLVEY